MASYCRKLASYIGYSLTSLYSTWISALFAHTNVSVAACMHNPCAACMRACNLQAQRHGSIPPSLCHSQMYAGRANDKVNPIEELLAKWTRCHLSGELLQEPVVADEMGNVYNKVSLQPILTHV